MSRLHDGLLFLLLRGLGFLMSTGSRFMPSLRSQITRSMTFEVSAGDNVCQYWEFDATHRRIRSGSGPSRQPDGAVHFQSSGLALRALTSTTTVDRVVTGIHRGSVTLQGSAFVLLWFHGLTRKFVKRGRTAGPNYELPHRYLEPDPNTWGGESVVIEPAVTRLAPEWTDAWRARSTLLQVRSTTDEPVLEP
ncbi:hypothetical protein [Nocardioides sp. WS12]|uniref:hypothetical protein n=1 Tax=Nocardioides sp. WS12 TaxID=2486272 RepID=UPI0015F9A3B3|nr:hypothetical protein [Nocardioides sp. WS12]